MKKIPTTILLTAISIMLVYKDYPLIAFLLWVTYGIYKQDQNN